MNVFDWLLTVARKVATLVTSVFSPAAPAQGDAITTDPPPTQGTDSMDATQKTALQTAVATLVTANQAQATDLADLTAQVNALEVGGDTAPLLAQIEELTNLNAGLQDLSTELQEKVTESTTLAVDAKDKIDAAIARLQQLLPSQGGPV
jgi:hypothetical protein